MNSNDIKVNNKLIALVLVVLTIILGMSSQLNPFGNIWSGDEIIYLCAAKLMKNGGMIYTDFFDQKGPLFYFIQYIGVLLGGKVGLWIIELIFIAGALYFTNKIICFYTDNRIVSFATLCIYAGLFGRYMNRGDMTDEFIVFPITYALYIFIRYLRRKNVRNYEVILVGLSFGSVILMKFSCIGIYAGMMLYILFVLIKDKRFSELGKLCIYFIIGAAVIIFAMILWLYFNGALSQMIEDYIVFNLKFSDVSMSDRANAAYELFKEMFLYGEPFFIVFWIGLDIYTEMEKESKGLYLSLIFSLLLTVWSGKDQPHYYIVLISLFIIPITVSLEFMWEVFADEAKLARVVMGLMTILCLFQGIKTIAANTLYVDSKEYSESMNAQGLYINEMLDEGDTIYSDWGATLCYYCDRYSTTKYYFTPPVSVDSELYKYIQADTIDDLAGDNPDYIYYREGFLDEEDLSNEVEIYLQGLIEGKYELIDTNYGYELWKLKTIAK